MGKDRKAHIGELDERRVDGFGGDYRIAPIVRPLARRRNQVGISEICGLALGRTVEVHLDAAHLEVVDVLQGDFVLRGDFIVKIPHG